MSRVLAPHLVAVDDRILAVLRDADDWLSTLEVAQLVGGPAIGPAPARGSWQRLVRLRRAGRVERERRTGWRSVFWRYLPPPDADTLQELG